MHIQEEQTSKFEFVYKFSSFPFYICIMEYLVLGLIANESFFAIAWFSICLALHIVIYWCSYGSNLHKLCAEILRPLKIRHFKYFESYHRVEGKKILDFYKIFFFQNFLWTFNHTCMIATIDLTLPFDENRLMRNKFVIICQNRTKFPITKNHPLFICIATE